MVHSALGLTAQDAEELRAALFAAARANEAIVAERDAYGQRYMVDFVMRRRGLEATVRCAWIIRTSEDFPRLDELFCFVRAYDEAS